MALSDRYRTPSDMPPRIAVFPLRGAILLPRSELPLNIFEPRYLAMIDDALSGHRIIGMVQPEQTMGPAESPEGKAVALKRIGCAGRITAYQELSDGRLGVALTGVSRFTMVREPPTETPYRLADVSYDKHAADFGADDSVDGIDRARLLRVLKSYLTVRQLEADWNAINRAPLEPLINGLSTMSPFGPEEKQALLEARDTQHRAEVLITLAEMAIAAGGATGGGTLQ